MMGTTHALIGMLLGSTVQFYRPELLAVIGLAGFVGGIFPDLDMPFEHRKTLHFPVYYSGLTVLAAVYAVIEPGLFTLSAFYFVLAAAVHSVSDVFGGGLEKRPWEGTSDRAVYDHFNRRWWNPRRWIPYDGSPEDLFLTALTGILCYLAFRPELTMLITGTIAVSAVYTAVRKKIVSVGETVLERFTN
jgi:hypothetical protein